MHWIKNGPEVAKPDAGTECLVNVGGRLAIGFCEPPDRKWLVGDCCDSGMSYPDADITHFAVITDPED